MRGKGQKESIQLQWQRPVVELLLILVALLLAQHNAIKLVLEPFDSLVLGNSVIAAHPAGLRPPARYPESGSLKDDVEIHAVDTNCRVVLDTQIDVFVDAKAEAAVLTEISDVQLVFLHFQTLLQNLLSLVTTHGRVHSDLFVSFDTKASDCEACFGCNWNLTSELFQHL